MESSMSLGTFGVRQSTRSDELPRVAHQVSASQSTHGAANQVGAVRTLTFTDLYRNKLRCSERTAHNVIREAWFPKPIALAGGRTRRWFEHEVDAALLSAPRHETRSEPPQLADARAKKAGEAKQATEGGA